MTRQDPEFDGIVARILEREVGQADWHKINSWGSILATFQLSHISACIEHLWATWQTD